MFGRSLALQRLANILLFLGFFCLFCGSGAHWVLISFLVPSTTWGFWLVCVLVFVAVSIFLFLTPVVWAFLLCSGVISG